MRSFLATWGKRLRKKIRVIDYRSAFQQRGYYPGIYVFSDVERLTPREAEWAAAIHNALVARWGENVPILNHPTRSMKRYELLRTLYQSGINSHNVYRVTEGRLPRRYPVFIRSADDHEGAGTALLHSESQLRAAIEAMNVSGVSRDDKIIVEFCDTADPQGIYRKYSAFNVGGTIIPRHICFSRNWQIKQPDLSPPELIGEELDFAVNSPHAEDLNRIFRIAGIRYGRIDYAFQEGRLRVWEINTNPMVAGFISAENPDRHKAHNLFVERLSHAFDQLDEACPALAGTAGNPIRKQILVDGIMRHARYYCDSIIFMLPFSSQRRGILRMKLAGLKNRTALRR
jgi:hypothetical protein